MPKKDPKIEALERKAKKAREEIKYRKICQKYNMKPLETSREYTTRVKREAKALPKELRQQCLDTYHKGGLTLEQMATLCGVTIHQMVGVYLINRKRITYTILNEKTV